MSNITTCSNTL